MDSTSILPRGGCRFIAGDPRDIHTKGGAISCGKPVARKGGAWCREHERVVFMTLEKMREPRKAA
jgi:hypothetical protein